MRVHEEPQAAADDTCDVTCWLVVPLSRSVISCCEGFGRPEMKDDRPVKNPSYHSNYY